MEVLTIFIIALLSVLVTILFSKRPYGKKYLPGPRGLPFVGYLPFMTKKPYVVFDNLRKRYGPVYRLQLGSQNVVAICDFKLIKEAFTDDVFMGRPPDLIFEISETTKRTGALRGMPYKEQRRFCLQMLKGLGFGKTRMEEFIRDEIVEVTERMAKLSPTPFRTSDILAPSVSNTIATFIFGRRLKYDHPMRVKLDHFQNEVSRLIIAVGWQALFPWLGAFLRHFGIGNRGKLVKAIGEIADYCRRELEEHESTIDPNIIRDFMDGYLMEIEKKCVQMESTFKRDTLLDLSRQFFQAGSESVRVSVDWLLLLCASSPEMQKRIHSEIDETLGRDRFPTGQDRLSMPYTEAAIWEMMRWKSILPINIMRYTLKDTELNGYFIPKHSKIIAVFWAVDHDETLWGKDAHVYRPERFLSEDGRRVVKPEYFIPFSIGKRSCPGKALAEIEVFLYLTGILQKFEVALPPGKEADFEDILGIVVQPRRQDLCFKPRH